MGGSDSNVADVGVAFAFGWVGAAAASPPWPGAVEACGDVGGDSGFGVATSQVRSAEARALGLVEATTAAARTALVTPGPASGQAGVS